MQFRQQILKLLWSFYILEILKYFTARKYQSVKRQNVKRLGEGIIRNKQNLLEEISLSKKKQRSVSLSMKVIRMLARSIEY